MGSTRGFPANYDRASNPVHVVYMTTSAPGTVK
jgi:hypothetical protein